MNDSGPGENSWTRAADPAEVAIDFRDWNFGWLDVSAVIASANELLAYPMVDRDPVSRWTFGSQTLLGDAAHPMYPIGSNGASQAIIDARTIAFERAPQGFVHIHDVIEQDELEPIAAQYKKAAGCAPALLNERASLSVG